MEPSDSSTSHRHQTNISDNLLNTSCSSQTTAASLFHSKKKDNSSPPPPSPPTQPPQPTVQINGEANNPKKNTIKKIKIKKKKNNLIRSSLFGTSSEIQPSLRSNNINTSETEWQTLGDDKAATTSSSNCNSANTTHESAEQFLSSSGNNTSAEANLSSDKDALYDMIEKIQGDRLDNQRCELTQDYSVSSVFLYVCVCACFYWKEAYDPLLNKFVPFHGTYFRS